MSDPQPPPPPKKRAQTIRIDKSSLFGKDLGPRRAHLVVIRGGQDLGIHASIEGTATLGRCPDCTLRLQDLGVSWQHARISPAGAGAWTLEDVGSTNGTRVNGQRLEAPHTLSDGDKIVLGDSVVRFSLADELDVDFQSQIGMLVGTDPLTGLESKRRFDDALDFALSVARQGGTPVAMLMMDMDGVKQINDTHGHFFGAHVIGETGRIIAKFLRDDGHASRFGGDEFSAFLPGLEKAAALEAAEEIRAAVETAGLQKDGIPLKPTISIGVACAPADADVALALVEKADAALYRAKADGKNCVRA
jgi:two-component system cell cycle response regulator